MELQTSIRPRRDGTVIVRGLDGKSYLFTPDDEGALSCNVTHEPTVAHLLRTEYFYPLNEADFNVAVLLTKPEPQVSAGGTGDTVGAEDGEDEDFDPLDDDPEHATGLPVEANTPPAPAAAQPQADSAGDAAQATPPATTSRRRRAA